MHHKFMVIDGEIVVTGSYNWSAAAEERNDENLVVIRDRGVAGAFEREFERIWSQSPP
jgi:phosphatidylserine/phosphatidylglycerophosphate/cardiolipin synthase-like enzyme